MSNTDSDMPSLEGFGKDVYYLSDFSKSSDFPSFVDAASIMSRSAPAPTPRRRQAIIGPIPGLARRWQRSGSLYCDHYWDYSHEGFSSLITNLQKLPKELPQKVYYHLIFAWAPLDPYPESMPNGGLIGLARLNRKPEFTDRKFQRRCLENSSRIIFDDGYVTEITIPGDPFDMGNRVVVESTFAEKCGLLDYYKTSEFVNMGQFVKALEQYQDTSSTSKQSGKEVDSNQAITNDGNINVIDDFIDWFWDFNVLDLKDSWYCTQPDEEALERNATRDECLPDIRWTSLNYLQIRPQYHALVRHISLTLSPEDISTANAGYFLLNATRYLSTNLTNLKSLILFIHLSISEFDKLLSKPNAAWICPILELTKAVKSRFEVRVGESRQVSAANRESERDPVHLSAEKCLERLLMPEALFEKEDLEFRDNAVEAARVGLGCEIEAGLGWMTMEGEDGNVQHEIGSFLLVESMTM